MVLSPLTTAGLVVLVAAIVGFFVGNYFIFEEGGGGGGFLDLQANFKPAPPKQAPKSASRFDSPNRSFASRYLRVFGKSPDCGFLEEDDNLDDKFVSPDEKAQYYVGKRKIRVLVQIMTMSPTLEFFHSSILLDPTYFDIYAAVAQLHPETKNEPGHKYIFVDSYAPTEDFSYHVRYVYV